MVSEKAAKTRIRPSLLNEHTPTDVIEAQIKLRVGLIQEHKHSEVTGPRQGNWNKAYVERLKDECDVLIGMLTRRYMALNDALSLTFGEKPTTDKAISTRGKNLKVPVCDTCNDTHLMTLHTWSGDEQEVMCTRCPTPCEKCRSRGPGKAGGPYCAQTPCFCECHERKEHYMTASKEAVYEEIIKKICYHVGLPYTSGAEELPEIVEKLIKQRDALVSEVKKAYGFVEEFKETAYKQQEQLAGYSKICETNGETIKELMAICKQYEKMLGAK